jgi:protein SCO1/2
MIRLATGLVLLAALGLPVAAQIPPPEARLDVGLPGPLRDVAFDQRLDQEIPLDLVFRDAEGRSVRLGDLFGERPVVLALAYYSCPMLCTQVLQGMASSLGVVSFEAGKAYDVITVSFDARDTPEQARAHKRATVGRYGREDTVDAWHFLVGDPAEIEALTEAVGFRFTWDPERGQFAHASGIMILTPEGRISRYFYGIEYAPRDLRLGLIEAAANRIGNPVDQLLLYCFQYDPATGRYGAVVMNMLRLGAPATFVGLALLILFLRRRWRRSAPVGLQGAG